MRRVRFSAAVSLDGYIAGPNGETDWIARDPDVDFAALFAEFDAALVGRRTFEEMKRHGAGLPGIDLHVVSSSLSPSDCENAALHRDPSTAIAEIRKKEGKDIWLFGGASLFASVLNQGLVDMLELSVSPVLLGEGLKLLPGPPHVNLQLVSERVFPKSGMVRLDYAVKR